MKEFSSAAYHIALNRIKGVGPIMARQLIDAMGSAQAVFQQPKMLLQRIPNLSKRMLMEIENPIMLAVVEGEVERALEQGISIVPLDHPDYPSSLRECVDAPIVLYSRGQLSALQSPFLLSVVGTRNITPYGRAIIERLVTDLAAMLPDLVIVSGLAYGVDVHAHEYALKTGLRTVGVLGHGLDRVYPYKHTSVAERMIQTGALLSEYPLGTAPERFNFVGRNRIIAGISQATLVIESAEKGGSLITADLALGYHREVLAVPGRIGDAYSEGCNRLIRRNRAVPILSASDILETLGWDQQHYEKPSLPFFEPDLPDDPIIQAIADGPIHINDLARKVHQEVSQVASALFDYELDGLIMTLPGGLYTLTPR